MIALACVSAVHPPGRGQHSVPRPTPHHRHSLLGILGMKMYVPTVPNLHTCISLTRSSPCRQTNYLLLAREPGELNSFGFFTLGSSKRVESPHRAFGHIPVAAGRRGGPGIVDSVHDPHHNRWEDPIGWRHGLHGHSVAVLCPIGSLAFYLLWRFDIAHEPLPDFNSRQTWYRTQLIPGRQEDT